MSKFSEFLKLPFVFMSSSYIYFKIKNVKRNEEKVDIQFQVIENNEVKPAQDTKDIFNVFSVAALEKRLEYNVRKSFLLQLNYTLHYPSLIVF